MGIPEHLREHVGLEKKWLKVPVLMNTCGREQLIYVQKQSTEVTQRVLPTQVASLENSIQHLKRKLHESITNLENRGRGDTCELVL